MDDCEGHRPFVIQGEEPHREFPGLAKQLALTTVKDDQKNTVAARALGILRVVCSPDTRDWTRACSKHV
jgi:hypothetical protein